MSVRKPHCVITGTRHPGKHDPGFHMAMFASIRADTGVVFIVGDATGVDHDAHEWCIDQQRLRGDMHIEVIREVVDPSVPSPRRFHERNQRMVGRAQPGDWCLAFPDDDSRGTWDCAKRASKAGLKVYVVPMERKT